MISSLLMRLRVYLRHICSVALVVVLPITCACADALPLGRDAIIDRLRAGYPGFVDRLDGNDLVFTDGARLPFDDGLGVKPFDRWLEAPDIKDMFRFAYPVGARLTAPRRNFDPGRARNAAFFAKVYGDCDAPDFAKSLVTISWLPKTSGQKLKITSINGVAEKLKAVSAELDALPKRFKVYLAPSAGTFNCRVVAGTKQRSAHGYGIAIDIAVKRAHYWRWAKGGSNGRIVYRNKIPAKIVRIFEKHGFIWGGRWHHYDTMHFEYRPELIGTEGG